MLEKVKKYLTQDKQFNAFNGVFVPTFLSIIGVIFFLRLGSIVGSVGVLGSFLIILLAVSVTITTGLALSSITTTIRIGKGGAYSIVSKTLGLEVGGSVGIPLVLAQIFSVVFYIFGFAEAWNFIFPDHSIKLVSIGVLLVLLLLNAKASIAVKAQVAVFLLILISLGSVFLGGGSWWNDFDSINLLKNEGLGDFWPNFALFFPAVTGLMAGIGLSGDLSDSKRQIPKGVLWAIGTTTLIYLLAIIWFSLTSSPTELMSNNLLIVEKSFYGPFVLAGILAATFSSALTTFVAAPKLMQALGEANIIPGSRFFAKNSQNNQPVNGILFAALIIFIALIAGNLDSIAPLLTMFFLLTYAILNIAVFIELALGLVSFRPTLKIPKIVPLYGALASVLFMFLINAVAGLIALVFLVAIYAFLISKKLEPKEGDVRSGLFRSIAEWSAKKIATLPESTSHTWKPNILIPVVITRTLLGNFPLIKAISYPNGTMTVLGVNLKKHRQAPDAEDLTHEEIEQELAELPELVKKFGKEGIFTASSIIETNDYTEGVKIALEAMESQVFHPNILFLPFKADRLAKKHLVTIFEAAHLHQSGVILVDRDEEIGLGSEQDIHVWIPPEVMEKEFYDINRPIDLSLLVAYQLYRNWKGRLHLWMATTEDRKNEATRFLKQLIYEGRLPAKTKLHISTEGFKATLKKAPQGDIHILPINQDDADFVTKTAKQLDKSFLFILDSGKEDILA